MKKSKKFFSVCLWLLLFSMWSLTAFAAVKAPASVKSVRVAKKTETAATLTWTKAARAEGYYVFRIDDETGEPVRIAKTKRLQYTVRNLESGVRYRYHVLSYNLKEGRLQKCDTPSPVVAVKVQVKKPGKVTSLRVTSYGDRSVSLKWNKAKNATGYFVYRYDEEVGKYRAMKKTSQTSCTLKNLTDGTQYSFAVCAYREVKGQRCYGDLTADVKFTAKAIDMSDVHGRYYNAKVKQKTTATDLETGEKITVKANTKVLTLSKRENSDVTAILPSKRKVKIYGGKITYYNLKTTTKYYTKEQAEAFVNTKKYASDTEYLIWVSQYTLGTYIFKGSQGEWRLVRTCPCVVGAWGNTPVRAFKLIKRGYQYGQPCMYLTWIQKLQNGYAFHARTYLQPNVMRAAASGGCIRLNNDDLQYLCNTCPLGTRVISY